MQLVKIRRSVIVHLVQESDGMQSFWAAASFFWTSWSVVNRLKQINTPRRVRQEFISLSDTSLLEG